MPALDGTSPALRVQTECMKGQATDTLEGSAPARDPVRDEDRAAAVRRGTESAAMGEGIDGRVGGCAR